MARSATKLERSALWLWEAVVAISAGKVASSTALIGFGLDSVIEVASATAVAWQFSVKDPEARERVALRSDFGVILRAGRLHHGRIAPRTARWRVRGALHRWHRAGGHIAGRHAGRNGAPVASWGQQAR
jgi:hypothetical protein